jgi:UDP-2-acetamido-2,6-beta-L-arabino-hexul-4-ose reductase
MQVLVTGANGFIGKNLIFRLNELKIQVSTYTRKNSIQDLKDLINDADFIVHLAGVNRPKDEKDFKVVNSGLTKSICSTVSSSGKKLPILIASSTQAEIKNAYGKSKLDAENALKQLENDTGCPIHIYRLPGVFGKWCKPNYNSVVATFCHNISHDLPVQINNPDFELSLVYVDDVVEEFVSLIQKASCEKKELSVQPEYKIKLV